MNVNSIQNFLLALDLGLLTNLTLKCPATKIQVHKGRFTRYDCVNPLFRVNPGGVNQTYNSLNGPKSCRRPVVSLSYATK